MPSSYLLCSCRVNNRHVFLYLFLSLTASSVSFRLVYTGRDTVGLLLTKKQKSYPRNFTSLQNSFSSSLFGSSSLPFSCKRTTVTTHMFFVFLFCGERVHFATSSSRTLFLSDSSVCRWNGNNDTTATSVSHVKKKKKKSWSLLLWTIGGRGGTISDYSWEHYSNGKKRECWFCVIMRTTNLLFFYSSMNWTVDPLPCKTSPGLYTHASSWKKKQVQFPLISS